MIEGALEGGLQKIPFDLGEAVMEAARTPQNVTRLAEAAQRVREWHP